MLKLHRCDVLINVNRKTDCFNRVKRWFLESPYDHIFMYMGKFSLGISYGFNFHPVFESYGRGTAIRSISEHFGEEVVLMRPVDQTKLSLVVENALELASDPQAYYDYLCVVKWVIPQAILRKLHLENLIPLSWQRDRRQICSEAIFEVFFDAGYTDILPDSAGLKLLATEFIADRWKYIKIPMPGDFINSPALKYAQEGILSQDWI